jgi:hypothetical protein
MAAGGEGGGGSARPALARALAGSARVCAFFTSAAAFGRLVAAGARALEPLAPAAAAVAGMRALWEALEGAARAVGDVSACASRALEGVGEDGGAAAAAAAALREAAMAAAAGVAAAKGTAAAAAADVAAVREWAAGGEAGGAAGARGAAIVEECLRLEGSAAALFAHPCLSNAA